MFREFGGYDLSWFLYFYSSFMIPEVCIDV